MNLPRLRAPAALAAFLLLGACTSQLQHGLEERDANEVVAALLSRGFHAAKVPERGKKPTWTVEVEEAEGPGALQVLAELRLPRAPRASTRALVESPALVETPAAERLRQLAAQAGDLEGTLETLSGVSQASVELAVPPAPRPGQPASPAKAAVLLRVRPEALEHLTGARAELKALVAAGVDGLRPEEVVLVLDPVALQPPPAAPPAGAGRPLVEALAAGVALLSVVLVALATLLRRQRRPAAAPVPAPASPPPAPVLTRLAAPGPRKAGQG